MSDTLTGNARPDGVIRDNIIFRTKIVFIATILPQSQSQNNDCMTLMTSNGIRLLTFLVD